MAGNRGIREVPTVLDVKDPALRHLLVDLREQVISLRKAQAPILSPTNFKITPLAFANLLEWTRVTGADYYEILWNTTAQLRTATVQGVGDSQRWVDNVGKDLVTRFYWVRAKRYTGGTSAENGPKSGATLAFNAGVVPHQPPPPGHIQVTDISGHRVYYVPYTHARSQP